MEEHNPPIRTTLGGIGTTLASIIFVFSTGVPGLAAAILLVACWAFLPGLFVFTAGQILLVALFPDPPLLELVLVECGLLTLLIADRGRMELTTATTAIVIATAGLTLASYAVFQWAEMLWLTVGMLVLITALVSYGLHRYELFELDLIEVKS